MMAAISSEEREEVSAEDVKRCDACSDCAYPEHPLCMRVSRRKDRVLAEEAREPREAGDRETCDAKRVKRDRHGFTQAAHVPEILFAAESVNHRTRAEE